MIKNKTPNPLNVFEVRQVKSALPHFEYVNLPMKYNLEESLIKWIKQNLKNRFYAGKNVSLDSDNLTIKTLVGDKDFIIKGVDDSSEITALTLDMSAAGAATFNNDVTAFSDVRLKENIETIPDALNKVCQIRGVTFDRKDTDGPRQMGVIAQEVEEVAPEVIREDSSDDKIKSVAYGNMVALLIESVKELNEKVEKLEKTIINTKKINR